ncbi:hypothetical protein K1719_024688 [Acacia pycnantha]|nr:hypothetical protein K1719_024688 [Acacia pycnantha]
MRLGLIRATETREFWPGPRAGPLSQSFSRGYGSILPTSLAYIVPSTAVHFTLETRCGYEYGRAWRHTVPPDFQGPPARTGHHATCGALPARRTLPLSEPFPFAPASRHSSPSFGSQTEYALAEPFHEDQGGRPAAHGDPPIRLPCLTGLLAGLTRTHVETPWSVFQDG